MCSEGWENPVRLLGGDTRIEGKGVGNVQRGHAVPGLDTEARKVRRALVFSAAEWLSMAELRARQNKVSPI